jgi:hypothetical protein
MARPRREAAAKASRSAPPEKKRGEALATTSPEIEPSSRTVSSAASSLRRKT